MEEGTGLGEWQGLHIGKGGSVGRTEEGMNEWVGCFAWCVCVLGEGCVRLGGGE